MKINNPNPIVNANKSTNVNFKGAYKLLPFQATTILTSLSEQKVQKSLINCCRDEKYGIVNLNIFDPTVEQRVMNVIKELKVNNYMKWEKPIVEDSEYAKFRELPFPSIKRSKDKKVFGAIKMAGGPNSEADKLKQAIKRQYPTTKQFFETGIFLADATKNDEIVLASLEKANVKGAKVNIPLIESKFKDFIEKFIKESSNPNYVLCNTPLTVDEFKEFAKVDVFG